MAKNINELLIYRKAKKLDVAVSAILKRPCWEQNLKLHGQLNASVTSVSANIEEGFEQPTDRAFANYLSISKSSAGETAGHLRRAVRRGCIKRDEALPLVSLAEEIVRMEASLIRHLRLSDFKDRGCHAPEVPKSPVPQPESPVPQSESPVPQSEFSVSIPDPETRTEDSGTEDSGTEDSA